MNSAGPVNRFLIALAATICCQATASAATLFDPALRFRMLATEHFIIYFHQGEERLAPQLAAIAEDAWRTLPGRLGAAAPRRTHVVLADQSDAASGWAFPLPYNTIMVTAAWPSGSDFIGHTDDWLRLVFVHEFTHIVHLDQSASWAGWVRRIFGRTPLAFPNLFLPTWQIEGLATWAESAATGEGRLFAGNFRQIERQAARAHRVEPLDRVNGGLTDWPGGGAPYAYGLGFHNYLAERYGADRIARLAGGTAGRVPFTASRVFEGLFGRSLGALWKEYQAHLAESAGAANSSDAAVRLTTHGYTATGPRFLPCAGSGSARAEPCESEIVYSRRTPHDFPELRAVSLDGRRSRRVASRFGGSAVGVGRGQLVFDQEEIHRNVGVYSDLFVVDVKSGRVEAITSGERLQDPDWSPDGSRVVAVREGGGAREMVLVRLTPPLGPARGGVSGRRIPAATSEPVRLKPALASEGSGSVQYNAPRWSPDGRLIAVERHRAGHPPEIVVVDPDAGTVNVIASASSTRFVTPAWTPDGQAIVAAAAAVGEPFNLHEFPVASRDSNQPPRPARQLTFTTAGATWPDVSPDGRTIVYVGYTADGFDLFLLPYLAANRSGQANPASLERPAAGVDVSPSVTPPISADASRRYSPWATLAPTSWSPIIESGSNQLRAGVAVGGYDVLGYHSYAASATWLLDAPSAAERRSRSEPDWSVAYAYDRWRPTLLAAASSSTSFFAGPATEDGSPSNSTLRERELEAGMVVPFRRVRRTDTLMTSLLRSSDSYSGPAGTRTVTRGALRLGASSISARRYGFSISHEDGIAAGGTVELVRRSLGSAADATVATGDVRAYLPGAGRHHVLAVRLGGGISRGEADMGRTFLAGGAAPADGVVSFKREAFGLLRTFPTNAFAGTRVAVVNADYRFPLATPQRGVGTWPLFLHTIHAALFADAGHAWLGPLRAADLKTSAGAELSFDVVAAYALPLTLTIGGGWGRDGAGDTGSRAAAYIRVGRAF